MNGKKNADENRGGGMKESRGRKGAAGMVEEGERGLWGGGWWSGLAALET